MHEVDQTTEQMVRSVLAYAENRLRMDPVPLDKGLLTADPQTARLTIHYDRYADAVTSLLKEVLALQYNGDKAATAAFFDRWTSWKPELHEKLAERIRSAQGARWRIVRYAALGE